MCKWVDVQDEHSDVLSGGGSKICTEMEEVRAVVWSW